MLIVATPKSASSSLVETLLTVHGLSNQSQRIRENELRRCPVPRDFRQLELFHRREVADVDESVVAALSRPRTLAKLHLPPTENNQRRLERVRKVVLLRDPREVVRAYRRGNEAGVFNLHHPAFAFCISESDWMQRAEETGVLAELERFVEGWRRHEGDRLLIESEELIGDPGGTLARIEAYLELPPSGGKQLARARYTRGPQHLPSTARILFARRKIIAERLARDLVGLLPSLRVRSRD